jgi:hypothetical protein
MTPDPITAALDQLAVHDEQITQLDHREAGHHTAISGRLGELADFVTRIGRTLEDHASALTRLVQNGPDVADADGYSPSPAPAWWRLTAADRQDPVARLRAWVEQVYRPGYGHLTATLGSCWESHDLCLYGLDILAELWSVLYLQPQRTAALLSAQAEYQARVLPAMADQFRLETSGCGHPRGPLPAGGRSWSPS